MEIQDIEVKIANDKKVWTIITQQGDITFKADTFRQIIRKRPTFQLGQSIPYDERGGFSFDLTPGDKLNGELRPDIVERRKKESENYELAKRRFGLRKELENLNEKRDSGQIQTKDFLIEKKELKEKIDSLTFQLRGTLYEEQ